MNKNKTIRHIVLIGNGIAGITCARHIRKASDDRVTVVSAESAHFYARTALMYIYMGHLKYEHTKPYEDTFWSKNRIDLVHAEVESIDTTKKSVRFREREPLSYDVLVIATGSITQKFNWPGQNLHGVQGLYHYQDLLAMQRDTQDIKQAVIVGGGLIGAEMAEMLHTRKIAVKILIKDAHYWSSVLPAAEAGLVARQIEQNGVELIYHSELKEIRGDARGKVHQVLTSKGQEIDCDFVGIATGVTPNISLVQGTAVSTAKGVLVNEYFETNLADIYAIGDCAEFITPLPGRKKLEQVWYTGRMHGETLAQTICGRKTPYRPGPWFNSAKFFDLEYQTYGLISGALEPTDAHFFWQDAKRGIGFGAVYDKTDGVLKGVNSYGIRLRHAMFDRWLKDKATIDTVLARLTEAVFDPEFSRNHVPGILSAFNRQTGRHVVRKKKAFSMFGR